LLNTMHGLLCDDKAQPRIGSRLDSLTLSTAAF
jgi:hypothetical protein